jgi:hypothetical protein
MKEYDKLANEYSNRWRAPGNTFFVNVEDAYRDGFLKAREMSAELIDDHDVIGDKLCMVQCLLELGEKEV